MVWQGGETRDARVSVRHSTVDQSEAVKGRGGKSMRRHLLCLGLGLSLLSATPALAGGPEEALPVGEILHLEPDHLLALGVGVLAGATVLSPYLEISELTGVAIGVISGELLYRSALWPFEQRRGWFQ